MFKQLLDLSFGRSATDYWFPTIALAGEGNQVEFEYTKVRSGAVLTVQELAVKRN